MASQTLHNSNESESVKFGYITVKEPSTSVVAYQNSTTEPLKDAGTPIPTLPVLNGEALCENKHTSNSVLNYLCNLEEVR
jgi:hypothetical protein